MTTRSPSRIKGAASLRRLLRRLPDGANEGVVNLLKRAGPVLADRMRARLPSRTGAVRGGIGYKVSEKQLSLKVGLLTKAGRSNLFYGHILDVGNKAKVVVIKRGPRAGASMQIPVRAGLFLERQGLTEFRKEYLDDGKGLLLKILQNASQGVGDD